jgi:hypothetical protein
MRLSRSMTRPDPKKAATLSKLAESVGGNFTTGQVLRPHHFNKILALAEKHS